MCLTLQFLLFFKKMCLVLSLQTQYWRLCHFVREYEKLSKSNEFIIPIIWCLFYKTNFILWQPCHCRPPYLQFHVMDAKLQLLSGNCPPKTRKMLWWIWTYNSTRPPQLNFEGPKSIYIFLAIFLNCKLCILFLVTRMGK